MNENPSNRFVLPKVNRGWALMMSRPTVMSNRPRAVEKNALMRFFASIAATMVRPKIAREKKAGGPNCSATLAMGTERKMRMMVPTMPPVVFASRLAPSARPGSPFFVRAYPSMATATAAGVPGVLIAIAVIVPP